MSEHTNTSDVITFTIDSVDVEIVINEDEITLWIGDDDGDVLLSLTPETARGFAAILELAAQKKEAKE